MWRALRILNTVEPVKMTGSLIFFSRKPIQIYLAIQTFIDRKSNAWFTLGSENETTVCDRSFSVRLQVTVFKSLNDRQSPMSQKSTWTITGVNKTQIGPDRTGSRIGSRTGSWTRSRIRSWIGSRKNVQNSKFKIQNSKFCWANYTRVTTVSRTFYLIQVWYSFILL